MPLIRSSSVVTPTENEPSEYFIRKMMNVLSRQGQIEPLQVKFHHRNDDGTETYETFLEDTHAADIMMAARRLGWSHVSICIMNRYEA
jgi:hypothetical protein